MSTPKRPKDTNQRAKLIVELLTEQKNEPVLTSEKNAAAVELGRLGGLKGGKARAKSLSPKKRESIARKAANTRWKNKKKK